MKHIFIIFCTLFISISVAAQTVLPPDADSLRLEKLGLKLRTVAAMDSVWFRNIEISVGKMPLPELVRNIARTSQANLSVKGLDEVIATCNFSNARVVDLVYFLCKEYRLDLDVVGNIVSIFPAAGAAPSKKIPDMHYRIATNTMGYDLNGDRLVDVSKRIAELTGVNVIIPESLLGKSVSGFVSSLSVDQAIATLASTNGLHSTKENGMWTVSVPQDNIQEQRPGIVQPAQGASTVNRPVFTHRVTFPPDQLTVDSLGLITAQIGNADVQDIILELCVKMGYNYFFASPVRQQTSVYVKEVEFDTLLGVLLSGTQYSFYCENGIYIFGAGGGKDGASGLSSVKVVPMHYRSASKIEEFIPESIKAGLQIKSFPDLNSIILSGDRRQALRVETFLASIDKRVPLVTMEIIIADVTKSDIREAGVGMGIGDAPVVTSGTLSPGIDMTLGASSVNNLINSFNGFGSINLGKVNPDFYMTLKLLEEKGNITINSTPKLSTLNGHEATLKSGEKRYYKEITNSFFGSQTPIQNESYVWKDVEANMNIKITPFVSEDKHITLDIEIEQTEFTDRVEPDAPPGTATRSFKSLIRVQNEEMVLLGGIERNSSTKTSGGIPFIARIPVLKWIFGSSEDNKTEHRLNVFIKPTVID